MGSARGVLYIPAAMTSLLWKPIAISCLKTIDPCFRACTVDNNITFPQFPLSRCPFLSPWSPANNNTPTVIATGMDYSAVGRLYQLWARVISNRRSWSMRPCKIHCLHNDSQFYFVLASVLQPSFSRGWNSQSLKLTTSFRLVPKLSMPGD